MESKRTTSSDFDPKTRSVRVRGDSPVGLSRQRRRFVHPIRPSARFVARLYLRIDTMPTDPANPICLGVFASAAPLDRQGVCVRIRAADSVWLSIAGKREARLALASPLVAGRTYRFLLTAGATIEAVALEGDGVIGRARLPNLPDTGALDEFGIALDDTGTARLSSAPNYAYQLLFARIDKS